MTNDLNQAIELAVAQRFLCKYNSLTGSDYLVQRKIIDQQAPDVECEDVLSGEKLYLEIGNLQNIEGDYRQEMERIRGERVDLSPSQGRRGNMDSILSNLEKLLQDKLLHKHEGTPTALVIGRIITFWTVQEWLWARREQLYALGRGKEDHFPKGIWFQCAENEYLDLCSLGLEDS